MNKKTTKEIPFGGSAGMASIGFGDPFGLESVSIDFVEVTPKSRSSLSFSPVALRHRVSPDLL
jgi:hypothetical protein